MGPWRPKGRDKGPKINNPTDSGTLEPLGAHGPRCIVGLHEAQFTLVLPQRGEAILGVSVWGAGQRSGLCEVCRLRLSGLSLLELVVEVVRRDRLACDRTGHRRTKRRYDKYKSRTRYGISLTVV